LEPPTPLRDPADGSDFGLWPGVGIDLHLMSPTIVELPLGIRPRLFINGEVTAQFPPERRTANEAALQSKLELPPERPDLDSFPTTAIQGVGAETRSVPKTFQFGAQVGLAFPIEVLGRKVRIKPSFGWVHYKLDVDGRLLTAIKDDVNGDLLPISSWGPNLRDISLSSSTTRSVNAIGPGIEFELESGQFGPIGAAMFFGLHAYKVLSDRTIKLKDKVTFPDGTLGGDGLLEDTYRANWSHEIDPWMYRFRMGIRFHYIGD